jgi:hypothetical protein
MTVIKVPKTPAKAFNPKRPASALLLSQIEHLEHAIGREPKRIKRTEGQAARYIAELTAELLRQTQTTVAPTSRAIAPAVAPTTPGAGPVVTGGTKTAPTKAHAAFNKTLVARGKSKRKTPKKTTKRRRSR